MKKAVLFFVIILLSNILFSEEIDSTTSASKGNKIEKPDYLSKGKVISKFYEIKDGNKKFVGYGYVYEYNKDTDYEFRVTNPGPDIKWYTSDDEIELYYLIKKRNGLIINIKKYDSFSKSPGVYTLTEKDTAKKETFITKYKKGKPLYEEVYKKNKLDAIIRYEYDDLGFVILEETKDSNQNLSEIVTYTRDNTADGFKYTAVYYIIKDGQKTADGSYKIYFYNLKSVLVKAEKYENNILITVEDFIIE